MLAALGGADPWSTPANGFVQRGQEMLTNRSAHDYARTVERLLESIDGRGLRLFARVDHAAGAREVGLELADEQVLIFGSAKGGTSLMQADPRIGLELPLRIVVWAAGGEVLVGYRDPHDWRAEYELDEQHDVLDAMTGLLAAIVSEATAAPPS